MEYNGSMRFTKRYKADSRINELLMFNNLFVQAFIKPPLLLGNK